MAIVMDVDTDKKCTICGKPGVTNNGICLDCIADGKMNFFTQKVKSEITVCLAAQFNDNTEELNRAWIDVDGEPLKISIALRIYPPNGDGHNEMESVLSFVGKKVRDKQSFFLKNKQMSLFDDEKDFE